MGTAKQDLPRKGNELFLKEKVIILTVKMKLVILE